MSQTRPVSQLQRFASRNNTEITELLRKALVVARKLEVTTFSNWIGWELNGYTKEKEIPEYRHITVDVFLRNPSSGLVPHWNVEDNFLNSIRDAKVKVPISALYNTVHEKQQLELPMPEHYRQGLIHNQKSACGGVLGVFEPVWMLRSDQAAVVFDRVRPAILEWSLRLEREGIMGEGMSFSVREKKIARQTININNFQGVIGDVSGSELNQNLKMTVKQGDIDSLRNYLEGHNVDAEDIENLKTALGSDGKPESISSFGGAVCKWIDEMVVKAKCDLWKYSADKSFAFLSDAIARFYGIR